MHRWPQLHARWDWELFLQLLELGIACRATLVTADPSATYVSQFLLPAPGYGFYMTDFSGGPAILPASASLETCRWERPCGQGPVSYPSCTPIWGLQASHPLFSLHILVLLRCWLLCSDLMSCWVTSSTSPSLQRFRHCHEDSLSLSPPFSSASFWFAPSWGRFYDWGGKRAARTPHLHSHNSTSRGKRWLFPTVPTKLLGLNWVMSPPWINAWTC